MQVEPKRSKFKKSTINYLRDSVLDIIDIESSLSKRRFTPKVSRDLFIYSSSLRKGDYKKSGKVIKESDEIDYVKLNKNSFHIDFTCLTLEYPNHYNIEFTDKFFPIEIIGHGSFGLVVSVIEKETQAPYAIKIIDKAKIKDDDYIYKEVNILKKLDHPSILKIHDVVDSARYLFIVMELIQGGTLKDMIIRRYLDSKKYLFTDSEAAQIMKGIFKGIEYIHRNRIIHRDIKPENIMFRNKDDLSSVVICDFGLAYQLDFDETMITNKVGTLIYMAPELFAKRKYDHLVDSYSSGLIMYILISGGKHPFFVDKMSSEEYKEKIHSKEEMTFCETVPLLARNLVMKLCKYEAFFRYEINKALLHPWITRDKNGKIPLTVIEEYERKDKVKSFKNLLCASLFLGLLKKQFFVEAPKKTKSKVSKISKISKTPLKPIKSDRKFFISPRKNQNIKNTSSHKDSKSLLHLTKMKHIPKLIATNKKGKIVIKAKDRFLSPNPNCSKLSTNETFASSPQNKVKKKYIDRNYTEGNFQKNVSVLINLKQTLSEGRSRNLFLKRMGRTDMSHKCQIESYK